jgi:hypothetical protein
VGRFPAVGAPARDDSDGSGIRRVPRPCQTPFVARRSPLSSWLYKASRTTRDFEVLTGKNGGERYLKRRIRRVARRNGLGWWFRKTGL